jgi:putative transposase
MHRGFAFRLYPTPAQAETLGGWIGTTRLVYNLALEQRRDFWRQYRAQTGKPLGMGQQSKEVTDLRREHDFIAAVPRTCLEQALRDLDKAFSAFFARRSGFPTWRKSGTNDSIRLQAKDIGVRRINAKWGALRIPNLGWVKFRGSRDFIGTIQNMTIAKMAGQWAITFACDLGDAPDKVTGGEAVGIDRGVTVAFALSNGEMLSLPDNGSIDKAKRRQQRVLARRKKGSQRYRKQKLRIARISQRIARRRTHALHLISADIAARFTTVALEALNVSGMTASAARTVSGPGRNVRQKSGLNRAILDKGWSRFAEMLAYKLEARGGRLAFVPCEYTSQTCSDCGTIDPRSRKSQARFVCDHCGHSAHADTNAAIEIRRRSTALLLVEGGRLGRPVEPRTLAA